MSIWGDIWSNIQVLANEFEGNWAGAAVDLPKTPEGQAVVNAAGAWGFFEAFITALTDPGMWVSLGWLAAGLILMFIGARLWLGKPAVPRPPVVPVPV